MLVKSALDFKATPDVNLVPALLSQEAHEACPLTLLIAVRQF